MPLLHRMAKVQGEAKMITPSQFSVMQARCAKRVPEAADSNAVEREADLHQQILDECARRGWMVMHSRMDMPSTLQAGVPDFVIMRGDGKCLMIEAKSRTGKLSIAQIGMAAWAKKLGHEIHVVRSFERFLEIVRGVS